MVVAEGIKGPYGDKSMVSYGAGDHKRYGGISHDIAHWLVTEADMDVRVTILGHTQRGGVPASMDRIMASAFGVRAVDLLACGRNNRVVAWQNHDVVDLDLSDVVGHTRSVADDDVLVRTARGLGVYIGDVAC
jgi:6-phosphofructokinase 1